MGVAAIEAAAASTQGGWSDACGDRTVVHVDWSVDVEDPRRMSDFAVRHAYGEDDAAMLERLAVYVRFVLREPTTEYAIPQPRLTHPDPALVKHADVVGMKATRLQRFDSGLSVSGGVERGNNGLITHDLTPGWTDEPARQMRDSPRLLAPPPERA
jgi:hypothetical protein